MSRAVSPAVGVLLLTAVTLVLASAAALVAVDLVPGAASPQPVALSATANAATGRVDLVHESGPAVDVRWVRVRISIGGTRLRHQPPVPFTGARGFLGAPSGPFNPSADPRWEVGERASLRLAGTNDPPLTPDATVLVEVYRDDLAIARVEVTAT